MKLLLGCGKRKMLGWTGVDISREVNPDIVDNMFLLGTIKAGTIEAIKIQHSLEHLTYENAVSGFKCWFRVLKDGGELSIELPDLDKCYKMIKSSNKGEKQFGFNGLFGDPKSYFLLHKYAWDFKSLKDELKKVGFVNIRTGNLERINKCLIMGYDRDIRVIANKPIGA